MERKRLGEDRLTLVRQRKVADDEKVKSAKLMQAARARQQWLAEQYGTPIVDNTMMAEVARNHSAPFSAPLAAPYGGGGGMYGAAHGAMPLPVAPPPPPEHHANGYYGGLGGAAYGVDTVQPGPSPINAYDPAGMPVFGDVPSPPSNEDGMGGFAGTGDLAGSGDLRVGDGVAVDPAVKDVLQAYATFAASGGLDGLSHTDGDATAANRTSFGGVDPSNVSTTLPSLIGMGGGDATGASGFDPSLFSAPHTHVTSGMNTTLGGEFVSPLSGPTAGGTVNDTVGGDTTVNRTRATSAVERSAAAETAMDYSDSTAATAGRKVGGVQ